MNDKFTNEKNRFETSFAYLLDRLLPLKTPYVIVHFNSYLNLLFFVGLLSAVSVA